MNPLSWARITTEEILDGRLHRLAAGVGDGLGKRNVLGTDFHAVLGEAAFLDAAIAHERLQPFVLERLSGGMLVEQTDLSDRRRAHEAGVFVELRARFHATAARDAARNRIYLFLFLGRHTRPRPQIVSAVDRNPGLHALEILKDHAAVDLQIAHDWELFERFQSNGLIQLIDQSRASHARASIDQHGARAADLLEAIGIVGNSRGGLPGASYWIS